MPGSHLEAPARTPAVRTVALLLRPIQTGVSGSARQLASAAHRALRPARRDDRAPAAGPRHCRGMTAIRSSRGQSAPQASRARPVVVPSQRIPARATAPGPAARTRANPRCPRRSAPPRRPMPASRHGVRWVAGSRLPPLAPTKRPTAWPDRRSPTDLPSQGERERAARPIAQRLTPAGAAPRGCVRLRAQPKLRIHAAPASHSTVPTTMVPPERACPARWTSRVFALQSTRLVLESSPRATKTLSRRASIPGLEGHRRRLPARAGSRSPGGARRW